MTLLSFHFYSEKGRQKGEASGLSSGSRGGVELASPLLSPAHPRLHYSLHSLPPASHKPRVWRVELLSANALGEGAEGERNEVSYDGS